MKKVIVIVGPTGIGKTSLSVEIARKIDGEIIGVDSMQVYKGMDIGTAKVKETEKKGIKHHLIDIKEISENYSVYEAQKNIRNKIEEIYSNFKTPILVGGTGLYIKASLYDYLFLKEDNKKQYYEDFSDEDLYNLLLKKDKEAALKTHQNNRRRILRALNMADNDFKKSEILKKQTGKPLYEIIMIGLTCDRNELYKRIDERVEEMFLEGLVDEVKSIYEKYKDEDYISLQGISYKELFMYFKGELTLLEARELIKKKTRNYAKRQYTWFKNQFDVNWFEVDFSNFKNTIDEVMEFLKQENGK